MIGRDSVCVFCLTRCSVREKRPQLLTCLHSACLDCFKERVESCKNKKAENVTKPEANLPKNEGVGDGTDDDCCEIIGDCSETKSIVVPCLLCKVSTAEDQIRDNLFLQV